MELFCQQKHLPEDHASMLAAIADLQAYRTRLVTRSVTDVFYKILLCDRRHSDIDTCMFYTRLLVQLSSKLHSLL